ncbi:MAG TPA: hypothetical protein VGG69_05280 [Rhizomicrobium sp.]
MARVIFLLLAISVAAGADPDFATYANQHYGYSIRYPASLLKPVKNTDDGAGQAFAAISGDAAFRVAARPLAGRSPKELADEAQQICPGERPYYRVAKQGLAAVSCQTGDHIVYQKSLLRNGLEIRVRGEYPARERATWDPVVTSIARSMSVRNSP